MILFFSIIYLTLSKEISQKMKKFKKIKNSFISSQDQKKYDECVKTCKKYAGIKTWECIEYTCKRLYGPKTLNQKLY